MAIFGNSKLIWVLLEKIHNSHFWPFQMSLFGKNYWKKFGTAIFAHSEFLQVYLGKIVRKNFVTITGNA